MGTFQHKTLLVIGDKDPVVRLHAIAVGENARLRRLGEPELEVTGVRALFNDYFSFVVFPTGSKVGWMHHRLGEDLMERMRSAIEVGDVSGHVIAGYLEFGELDSRALIVSPTGTERLVPLA